MDAVTTTSDPILSIDELNLSFGGNHVLRDVTFHVPKAQVLALIGPNGAGKTSLLNVLTRVYTPDSGTVVLHRPDAEPVSLLEARPHDLVGLGVARTFQNLQLIPGLSALDNVLIGRHWQMNTGVVGAMTRTPRVRSQDKAHRRVCLETLEFLDLAEFARRDIATLPYGVNKRIELARALATKPRLLLLDEPAAGLNDEETEEMACVMRLIREEGSCTQVLVEHDMNMVMSTADSLVVLNFGEVLTTGTPDEVRNHPEVMAAYLGVALTES
ncbi:ABC transporter ATP-binding protein [Streptomyces sp. NPDC005728]|uniref:ABC transporter ATP-binding protein n=1 Tax=Streptomyces sp. NPDC005728 TaxID=3157054 RepID=UPI0033EEE702